MVLNVFLEITVIILLATVISGFMRILKQPLIIGYILTGIVVSPHFLNLVKSNSTMEIFSQIGVSLLLFIVGLSLNMKMLKDVGKISIVTGIGQVVFTSLFGYLIGKFLLGFSTITSIYIAVALTFSSTIIIMKLLSDKGDIDTLYGRISVGFLLVQDLIVIFVLLFISSLSSGGNIGETIFSSILTIVTLIFVIFFFTHYILEKVIKYIARSQEFLLLFSISWCFLLAAIFYIFNFSIEIGALIAGISFASSPYKYEISSKMKSLRDFFLILFFILLGSQMVFGNISNYIIPVIVLSLFILIGNPLIVMILMGFFGYTKRNSFFCGLTVAQISEFSLILISMGVDYKHLDKEILSLVTVVGIITITGSSYMIMYSNKIYQKISKFLKFFERDGKKIDEHRYHKKGYETILFGYNRIGFDLLGSLKKIKKKFLVVDYNPDIILDLAKDGFDCKYGDVSDLEMLEELDLKSINMCISTIRDAETDLLVIDRIKEVNPKCIIMIVADQIDSAIELYKHGASYVILPHFLGGKHISTMIENYGFDIDKFLKEKISHIDYLKKRKEKKQEHPNYEIYNF
jgi:Kef-type K+ transport system membrane component KefB